MLNSKIFTAGLVGAVVAFLLGFLLYGNLLTDFFMENSGSATGVMRGDDEMQWIPMILGHVTWGMLFAVIYGRCWAGLALGSQAQGRLDPARLHARPPRSQSRSRL